MSCLSTSATTKASPPPTTATVRGAGVGAQGGMGQDLVVDVGVDLGQLHDPVEGEDLARRRDGGTAAGPGSGCGDARAPRPRRSRPRYSAAGSCSSKRSSDDESGETPRVSSRVLHAGRLVHLPQRTEDRLHVDVLAAGEVVDGGIAQLGPGVDGQMALGQDGHAGDAVGGELVDHRLHHGGRPASTARRKACSVCSESLRFSAPQNSQTMCRPTPTRCPSKPPSSCDPRRLPGGHGLSPP